MGFGRDHAVEALENVGSNRVDVAMEYALLHPPSSPATLEWTRERRRLEQQRRNDNLEGQSNKPSDSESHTPKLDDGDKTKLKPLTEDELNMVTAKEIEEILAGRAADYLNMVKESLGKISLDIIEGSSRGSAHEDSAKIVKLPELPVSAPHVDEDTKYADSDKRGVVIVVSNFILDICRVYPDLESSIGTELLRRLKFCLEDPRRQSEGNTKPPSHCRVKSGCSSFSSLVHMSVIIFRAIPKLRPLVLRHGLVGMTTHCLRNCTLTPARQSGTDGPVSPLVWPRWLAPLLLFLEVMAQPTSVTLDEEGGEEGAVGVGGGGGVAVTGKPPHRKSEYGKVLMEHRSLHKRQTQTLKNILLAVSNKDSGKFTPKKKKDAESSKKQSYDKNSDATVGEEGKQKVDVQPSPLLSIPTFLPLLHSETQEACMILCLQLLGLKSKKGVIDKAHLERVCPPPEIVNAILLLLLRLLRSRHLSSLCLQMSGADLILRLPSRSFFPGIRDIISLLLRRMLEDEVTLNSMMETELRTLFVSVLRKQHPHTAASALQPKMSVNLKSL
jgi:hypothetical protein